MEIEREQAVRFIQDRIEKDAWLEEFFPKQMEVYHNAIEQTKEQLLKQINMIKILIIWTKSNIAGGLRK